MLKSKRAQSTLEYIIVFTIIVAAILVAANGVIRHKVIQLLEHVGNESYTAVKHVNFN